MRPEELIPLPRRIWKLHEGPVKHEGRFYSMNLTAAAEVLPPKREQIPILTAGVKARMIETAGRVSDGLVCHPTFSSRYVEEVVRPAIAKGADRTGRDATAVEIVGMLMCFVNDDEELARREVAAQIAFHTAPRAYAPMFEASGFAAEAERVRRAFADKPRLRSSSCACDCECRCIAACRRCGGEFVGVESSPIVWTSPVSRGARGGHS